MYYHNNELFNLTTHPMVKFSLPNSNSCEGYWDDNYKPIQEVGIWLEKDSWITKALYVESIVEVRSFRGLAFSKLDGTVVGNKEYYDEKYNICWPEGYVTHYIGEHNVMPTKRFYDYINHKFQT